METIERLEEWCPNCNTQLYSYLTLDDEESHYCPNYRCEYQTRYDDYLVDEARENYIKGQDTLGFVFEGLGKQIQTPVSVVSNSSSIVYQSDIVTVQMGKAQKQLVELNQQLKQGIPKPEVYDLVLDNIIGYDGIKRRLRANINHKGKKKIHTLIVGAAGTSKTVFLKSLEAELVPQGCNFHYLDAATMSKRGLLDYLFDHDDIDILALDEIDKVERDHQIVFLNMLETGLLQVTTFKNTRKKQVNEMKVIATGNNLENIIEPVRTRFMTMYVRAYTKEKYLSICSGMLVKKYPYITKELAEYIAVQTHTHIRPINMRDADRIGNSIRARPSIQSVDEIIDDIKTYAIPDDILSKLDKQT